jgi:peptidylprolyl isomerase
MTTRSLAAAALAVLALAVAGCGSSTAPGIDAAPSAGRTQPVATSTTTTPTTTTTTTTPKSTVPLPAAFKTKPTVAVPSGEPPKKLVVKNLITGTGPAATASSTVTVQYVGVLYSNGKQFDASWNDGTGQPVSFPLSSVIPGWQEGIPGMKEGGRRELIIPASLAYGKTARPASGTKGDVGIPANSALVFVIDLHAVS